MSKAKNCPFCDSQADKLVNDGKDYYQCPKFRCPASANWFTLDIWNTRATPAGYKLVPVEPADAMLKAAFGEDDDLLIGHADIAENAVQIYKAMIEAAGNE